KKALSDVLCLCWWKTLSPQKSENWSPVGTAKFSQRLLCRRRFALCFQHHAPVRCRKRKAALLSARTARNRWSHLIRSRAHSTIQVKNITKSKPVCSDGCRLRRGLRERKGSRHSFISCHRVRPA